MFAGAEALIGAFGLISSGAIAWVGDLTIQRSIWEIALANFFLLLVPTLLMGATLPMLVAHLVQRSANVGVSIGQLYFINTLGAALGAVSVGFFWLFWVDIQTTIYLAAALNFVAATVVMGTNRDARK